MNRLWTVISFCSCMALATLSEPCGAKNLIFNGDFSAGNTGFITDYLNGAVELQGTYCIDEDPILCNGQADSFGDHSSGDGWMMNVNGSAQARAAVWEQTINVEPHTDYIFSGWAAAWGKNESGSAESPAILRFLFNNSRVGGEFKLPAQTGSWRTFNRTWNSGDNTSLTLKIVDKNSTAFGNDFSLDDLYLAKKEDTSQLSGSTWGMSKLSITCQNITTNQSVKLPAQVNPSWNCEDAGLIVNENDLVKITIDGYAR